MALPPVVPPSPAALLTTPNWRITAETVTPGLNGQGTTDLFAQSLPCSRDDFLRFMPGGQLLLDEGATKCSASDPQTRMFSWALSPDQTKLIIDGAYYDILTLSGTTLELRSTFTYNGSTTTERITFMAF